MHFADDTSSSLQGFSFQHRQVLKPEEKRRKRSVLLGFDHVVSDRVTYQLTHAVHFKLAHDVGTVRFRRLRANPESYGGFFAGFAFRQKLYNLPLSRTQGSTYQRKCRRRLAAKVIDQDFGGARREERSVISKRFDGSFEVAAGV